MHDYSGTEEWPKKQIRIDENSVFFVCKLVSVYNESARKKGERCRITRLKAEIKKKQNRCKQTTMRSHLKNMREEGTVRHNQEMTQEGNLTGNDTDLNKLRQGVN